jgi:hypothetical protein
MRIRVRALVRVLVVAVALATLSAPADAFPTSASVAPAPAELSMSGDVELLPGVDFFHVAMHASQHATDPVAGSFAGNGELRGAGFDVPIPLSLAGPVTCLTTRGDTAAFLYPVTSATPPLLPWPGFTAHSLFGESLLSGIVRRVKLNSGLSDGSGGPDSDGQRRGRRTK